MRVIGPAFYDENEWEPDEPTLKEMLGFHYLANNLGNILLSPAQMHMIQGYMFREHGRGWKQAMQAFIDELTPAFEKAAGDFARMVPVVECTKPPKPPRNGPQFNPHARHGKGGRRR